MVILKSQSQVNSFVKRAGKKYRKIYDYTTDIGCSRKATVFFNGSRIILRTIHYLGGCPPKYCCEVLAIVKILPK
jgi:hypothetical protein